MCNPPTFDRLAAFEESDLVTAAGPLVAPTFSHAREFPALERDRDHLQAELRIDQQSMLGDSDAVRQVHTTIARVARTDSTVLLLGETGTGKELTARAIHAASARKRGPLVAINCAALTESLLESELFGHEKGAFTGAVALKRGKLEVADGGTVFFDEVGELAPGLQAKLLRVLQSRELVRVGGTRPIQIDVRIVAATNRALDEDMRAGRFRQDLYFRLNVIAIKMPPLRERPSDIPLLASHFVARFAAKFARGVKGISPDAMRSLMAYDWPGNVRELESAIERAIVLGAGEYVLREDLPATVLEGTGSQEISTLKRVIAAAKKRAVIDAFRAVNGSYTATARRLGIHPNYLHRLIRKLDLRATLEPVAHRSRENEPIR